MQAGAALASPGGTASAMRGSVPLLGLLTCAYTASFIDRQVLNLLVQPIKADLLLSDTELSILQGAAFGIAYIAMSPIFGRLADRTSRRTLLVLGVMLWSMATMACGLARSHSELFLARLAVGGAEACLTPAAWSMIGDSFQGKALPRAFSIYLMGPYLGAGLALIFGGALLEGAAGWRFAADITPWRLTFVAVGLPGIALALLFLLVREPVRRCSAGAGGGDAPPVREVLGFLSRNRDFYLPFYAGMGFSFVTLYAIPAWAPAFMIRRFGVSAASVGFDYGVAVLVAGSAGVLLGPWLARLLDRRRARPRLLLVPMICAALMLSFGAALFFVGSYGQALLLFTVAAILYSLPGALSASALQIVTPPDMRGVASSIYVLVISIVGLGAAPTFVALTTDLLFHDEKRVNEALAMVCLLSSLLCLACLRRAAAALDRRRPETESVSPDTG